MDNLSELAQELIKFEHDNDLNDNEVAFGSHLSVERIHDIKSSNSAATSEEAELLQRFMQSKSAVIKKVRAYNSSHLFYYWRKVTGRVVDGTWTVG